MRVLTIIDEDFLNYKVPSMYIGTISCDGKCYREIGLPSTMCQNDEWRGKKPIDMDDDKIVERYLSNDITKAIIFSGLEPFEQLKEMYELILCFRDKYHCNDDIVIYTGFYYGEIVNHVKALQRFPNIVIKFGRYVPNHEKHFDETLGVYLSSPNQYAERMS